MKNKERKIYREEDFLPVNLEQMKKRGWDQADFVYICGDAYVDHPSFGAAIITSVLEHAGYSVAMIAQPDWTPSGSWGFYCGPGASVAVWENAAEENVVYVGVVGNVGLEYTFDFPLSLSVDFRPRLMFGDGKVRDNGPFTLGVGVRYAF